MKCTFIQGNMIKIKFSLTIFFSQLLVSFTKPKINGHLYYVSNTKKKRLKLNTYVASVMRLRLN